MRLLRATTFRVAALVFLLQLGGAAALLVTVRALTHAQIDADAEAQARALRDALLATARREGLAALAARIDDGPRHKRRAGSVVLLADRGGRRVAGNLGAWPPALPAAERGATTELFRIGRDRSERMRLFATALPGGYRLLTGHVIESELHFSVVLEEAMASALVLAVALAGIAAWASVRMIDGKLGATVETARAVAAGDLSRRVPPDAGGDAFAALGDSVNGMLERIAMLMTELKIATDGLAHDLRSPLTRLRATLERALATSGDEETRGQIARALDEGDRLLAMLDTALRITRAEAGLGREGFAETDLGAMVADMAEVYGPVAEDLGFTIETAPADAPLALRGFVHRELLGQALANLIDNALKYGAGRILIGVARVGEGLVLSVADEGVGIAEAQRAAALARFGRLDAARTQTGAGLGLSLAAAVAHLHGGALSLHDAHPGLRVELALDGGAG